MSDMILKGITKYLDGQLIINTLNLTVESGTLVSLLGPSGSGKTTTLRMIAGFIFPDSGHILIDGQDFAHVPPNRRPTAMVFQNYALWPNMTVYQNIAFGLTVLKWPKRDIAMKVAAMMEKVGLEDMGKRYPAQLSGGQQQRVALARALIKEPKILLLDEPLSNLDAQLRARVRDEIREIQQNMGITTIFVTHDQDEALSISDHVAVLDQGMVQQFGTPNDLYNRPRTTFVGHFIGTMNFIQGIPEAHAVITPDGQRITADAVSMVSDTVHTLGIRPESVRIFSEGGPHRGEGQVIRQALRGHFVELVLRTAWGDLRIFTNELRTIGETLGFTFHTVLVYQDGVLQGDGRMVGHAAHDPPTDNLVKSM